MGKYSPQELQTMAKEALYRKSQGDPRWTMLLIRIMAKTGRNEADVVARIEAISFGVFQ